jgi:phage head maturation protease
VPNVSYARDLFEHIRLGNVRGSSFCFACYSPGSVEYTRKADGTRLRTIKKIDELYDVSAVVTPAYTQTSVEARSWEAQRQVLEEQPQQEQRFGMLPEEGEMALMK